MKKIITVTLNPAFDLHCTAESFEARHENYVIPISSEAGGKGVNISRALRSGGIDSLAFVVIGKDNGERFERLLTADGIKYLPFYTEGSIRENVTVHTKGDTETRISLDSFSLSEEVFRDLFEALSGEASADTLISFSGRIPKGIPKRKVIEALRGLKEGGAGLIIDSNSLDLSDLREIKPYLIKPNSEEISALIGREISSPEDALEVARELVARNISERVMISLGASGAVYASGTLSATVSVPKISPVSTIGAGDSTVAGYLAATLSGFADADRLRLSSAYGCAACLTEGTRPPKKELISELYEKIKVDIL